VNSANQSGFVFIKKSCFIYCGEKFFIFLILAVFLISDFHTFLFLDL